MGSTPRRLKNFAPRKSLRGSSGSQHRRCRSHHKNSTITTSSSVSDKLEALKNLIPAQEVDGAAPSSADQLFQETADYILLLRTQVSVLQKLVDFYGSSSSSSSLVQQ
ncbi:hypothetical protein Ccrd_012550 [Cynara cardunculus var. scolymus]|uniref:Uncharacterized protein n=1 Tax=Cynara cardunculus var. scolymus TaxID=59895 RepID=A0A103YHA6_CYNCS|nr:hypothetical protein Ccrd_012550 [Cynara cardunculus var. scolymus]